MGELAERVTGGNFIWLLSQLAHGESLTIATQLMFSGPLLTFALPVIVPLITMRLFAEEPGAVIQVAESQKQSLMHGYLLRRENASA